MTPRIPTTKLTLKEGGYYKRRDGERVGPLKRYNGATFSWKADGETYRAHGQWCLYDHNTSAFDLISEVPAKRIAPAAKARKVDQDTILCADKNGRLYERRRRPDDITTSDTPAERRKKMATKRAKARKVLVRWCFTVGDSMYARATRDLARREHVEQTRQNRICGPIERHEFTKASPKKASKP